MTICRELDRVASSQPYHAEQDQSAYEERRKASISPGKWSEAIAISLEEKLHATWSPEQITERFRIQGLPAVSFKTIYRWLYNGRLARVCYRSFGTKGSVTSPQKLAAHSLSANRFQIVLKRLVPVKRLGTGNWIPSFRVVGKVKDAKPRSLNAKPVSIPRFSCLIARLSPWKLHLV